MPEARHYDASLCETRKNSQVIICHSELVSESITSQAEERLCYRAFEDLRTDGAGASPDIETARTAKSARTIVRVPASAMAGTGAWSKSKTDTRSKKEIADSICNASAMIDFSQDVKIRKAAFTLAEVLITLGIIGVVAALTLPTLMAKYQRNVLINQAKKTLAILNNAYQSTLYDFGISNLSGNVTTQEEYEITNKFLSKLNIVEKFEDVPLIRDGVIPAYNGLDVALKEPDEVIEKWTREYYKIQDDDENWNMSDFYLRNMPRYCGNLSLLKYAYYLNDGSIIIFYPYSEPSTRIRNFLVDINGRKGPNKWGHDLLIFQASSKKPIIDIGNVSSKGGIVSELKGYE